MAFVFLLLLFLSFFLRPSMWALRRLEYACGEKVRIMTTGPNKKMWTTNNERILTYHLELDYFFGGDLRQRLRNCKEKICLKSWPTPQKVQRKLTTVLIFFLPSDALIRHLLSAGSNDSEWPFLGTGLVLPSSGRNTSHEEMLNRKSYGVASWSEMTSLTFL